MPNMPHVGNQPPGIGGPLSGLGQMMAGGGPGHGLRPPHGLPGSGIQSSGVPDSSALGWQAMVDPASGVIFYQNVNTGERSWTDPMWNPVN